VEKVIKKIFSLCLLFCFLTTIFHFHYHVHHYHEETSKQNVEQKNDVDYHSSSECEKCLTKNNKSELLCTTIELFKTPPTLSNNKSESFTNYNNHFNIYCRPPPLIVS
jgi:hypothetical protein